MGLAGEDEPPWLNQIRLRTFRVLSALAATALVIMVLRGVSLGGPFPWADVANATLFVFLLLMSFARPRLLGMLMWAGLASLFVNALDGLNFSTAEAVVPAHVLLPLLILYGALLGDLHISLAALLGVLGIYALSLSRHDNLDRRDMLMLTNLCVSAFLAWAAALSVWLQHCRLERALTLQTGLLRKELETRLRLQAMVTHDVRNPLSVLVNAAEFGDLSRVQQMARRIARIVASAHDLTVGAKIESSAVAITDIWACIKDNLAVKLTEKEQRLSLRGDTSLVVDADLTVLADSVLGNLLNNAMKFSPRGSTIELVAEREADGIRIAVLDEGPGMPADVIRAGRQDQRYRSRPGTDGEPGSGYGLRIAALCAARMNGRLDICDRRPGGAVSVLLPSGRKSEWTRSRDTTTRCDAPKPEQEAEPYR